MTTKYIVKDASTQNVEGNINFQNNISFEGRFDNGYRIYKALLTHIPAITSESPLTSTPEQGLIVGETYKILVYNAGDDFRNVGATTNATEEEFVATGRFPTNWTNGSSLTVENPTLVVNVLENTFEDEIVWQTNSFGVGTYVATSSSGTKTFPREKTSIVTTPTTPYNFVPFVTQPTISSYIDSGTILDDYIAFAVSYYDGGNTNTENGLLWNTPIEIKTYIGFKPTVYLNSFTLNGDTTVNFDVSLIYSGGSEVTEYGIVWSTSPNPTIEDNKVIFYDLNGTYSQDNISVFPIEYIYAKAYAINNAGVSYHDTNQVSFTPFD